MTILVVSVERENLDFRDNLQKSLITLATGRRYFNFKLSLAGKLQSI